MKRRIFIKKSISFSTIFSAYPYFNDLFGQSNMVSNEFPKRKLGRTNEYLSVLGFGGIIVMNETAKNAGKYVSESFHSGINYFDVAPTYGNAEERLGPALKPYRKNAFLACKTTQRSAKKAEEELNESLKKLKTDYFDLYQLHALTTNEDIQEAFGKNGAMETFLKAQKQGKIKYLGFSAHSEQAALKAMELFDFDTILFPVNFVCWQNGHFGPSVIEKASEKNMGILALKALALSKIPEGEDKPYEKMWYNPIEDDDIANYSLRFTLSKHATAAIPPGDWRFWKKAYNIAKRNIDTPTKKELDILFTYAKNLNPIFST